MGAVNAKNAATSIVNAGVSVTQDAFTNCVSTSTAQQAILCSAGNCPTGVPSQCTISNISQSIAGTSNVSCVQNASASATVSQTVNQAVQQEAAAVSTGFGLGPTDASNVVDATSNVSTAINTNFTVTLDNIAAASQSVTGEGCITTIYAITQGISQDMTSAGQQTATEIANATQQVTQTISQKATAVNLGGLILVIIIIVIVIVVGYSITKVESTALQTGGKILIPLALLAGGYLAVAYFLTKTWPFSQKKPVAIQVRVGPTYLPPVSEGSSYSQALTATGGTPPYNWSVVGSDSAAQLQQMGLTLDPSSGVLSAQQIPSNPSNFNVIFTAYVGDSSNPPLYGAQTYNLQVSGGPLTFTSPSMPTATLGASYGPVQFSSYVSCPSSNAACKPNPDANPTPSSGPPTGQWIFNVYDPNNQFYPLGLSLNSLGELYGTVSTAAPVGPATFWVYVQDYAGSATSPYNFANIQVTIPVVA